MFFVNVGGIVVDDAVYSFSITLSISEISLFAIQV